MSIMDMIKKLLINGRFAIIDQKLEKLEKHAERLDKDLRDMNNTRKRD